LTVYVSDALSKGSLKRGDKEIAAGRLGKIEVVDDEVRLERPSFSTRETSTASILI